MSDEVGDTETTEIQGDNMNPPTNDSQKEHLFSPNRYYILIEFAYKHLDFQIAELESVLDMHGIQVDLNNTTNNIDADDTPEIQVVTLPKNINSVPTNTKKEEQAKENKEKQEDVNQSIKQPKKRNRGKARRPFIVLSFPFDSPFVPKSDCQSKTTKESEDIATIILSRCILVRSVMELWGMGTTFESCSSCCRHWVQKSKEEKIKESDNSTLSVGQQVFQNNTQQNQSWKITVHTLGTKYTREEQNAMRAHFSWMNFPGNVQMADPTNEFVVIREIELDAMGSPLYPRHGQVGSELGKKLIPENDALEPVAVFFGRALSANKDTSDGTASENDNKNPVSKRKSKRMDGRGISHYSLKKRKYLGPTSMDAELAFIMTNLGHVRSGSFVMDPFVGTGSILLTCALKGAYVMGTDIDIRVLRGKSDHENILANFKQFDLPRPELIRSDNAIYHRHFRHSQPIYDAIICDPPYGIRAGARQSGSRRENPAPVLDENRHDHIAQTKPYAVSDVMADLLDMAARTLVMGGRLVYIIPSFLDFNPDDDLPRHECLQLMHSCYQPLSADLGRRMVSMKKIIPYDDSKRDQYLTKTWKNGPESAEKCANIREKLIEAAKHKPRYEERKAIRTHKRKRHKEEKKRAKLARTQQGDESV